MSTASPAVPAQPRMSSPARIIGTFVSPGKTFAEIAREPHFILAWCVQIVVSLIFAFLLVHRVGVYAMARTAMAQSPAAANMSPEQMQRGIAVAATMTRIFSYLAPLFTIIFMLVLAAIFLAIANFILGYEAKYKQALGMVSHAYLTLSLSGILGAIVVATMADPSQFNITNPMGTNLGFFMDKATSSPFLFALGTRLDIFSIWTVILLAIGLTCLGAKKGKFGSALTVVGGLWLLYIFVIAGVTAAFA